MKKDEFLRLLRQSLSGDVPPGVIEENIRYYDSYITGEMRKGTPEEEVIATIGDPRLIAKTIEDTTDGAGSYSETVDDRSQADNGYGNNSYDRNPYRTERQFHMVGLSNWYWKLLGILLIFTVIFILFSIIGGIFALLSPLIGPLFVIWLVVWLFRMLSGRR